VEVRRLELVTQRAQVGLATTERLLEGYVDANQNSCFTGWKEVVSEGRWFNSRDHLLRFQYRARTFGAIQHLQSMLIEKRLTYLTRGMGIWRLSYGISKQYASVESAQILAVSRAIKKVYEDWVKVKLLKGWKAWLELRQLRIELSWSMRVTSMRQYSACIILITVSKHLTAARFLRVMRALQAHMSVSRLKQRYHIEQMVGIRVMQQIGKHYWRSSLSLAMGAWKQMYDSRVTMRLLEEERVYQGMRMLALVYSGLVWYRAARGLSTWARRAKAYNTNYAVTARLKAGTFSQGVSLLSKITSDMRRRLFKRMLLR